MRRHTTALAAVLGIAALAVTHSSPAAAELIRTDDRGFVTRHEVVVNASPKEVWLALIAPAGWWRSEHTWSGDAANLTMTPQAGGCFCETIPEVDEPGRFTLQGSVEHMRVIQAYPESALRMQGALGPLQSEPVTGILTIAISTVTQGTRIVWEYNVGGPMRYEVPVISKAVDGVMATQLAALAGRLGPVEMPAPEPAPEREPANAAELSEGAGRAGGNAKPQVGAGAGSTPVGTAKSDASAVTKRPTPPPSAPVAEPASKPASVEDAFGDLRDDGPKA